jgi:hypothetical protein
MSDNVKTEGRYVFTVPVRMPFGNLIVPVPVGRKGKAKGEPKYSGTFLLAIDGADLKAAKAKAAEVAKARWPGRDLKELKFPFTTGDKRAEKSKAAGKDGAFFAGTVVLDARSKYEPRLAILEGKTVRDLEGAQRALEGKTKFYNGCFVVPQVNFVPYDGQAENGVGNPDGVTAYLDAVLWVKDGPRIGGSSGAEVFKAYAGTVSGESATEGANDDEIAF